MKIPSLTIIGGGDKSGNPDLVNEIEIKSREIIDIVEPTSSGKTTLTADIE